MILKIKLEQLDVNDNVVKTYHFANRDYHDGSQFWEGRLLTLPTLSIGTRNRLGGFASVNVGSFQVPRGTFQAELWVTLFNIEIMLDDKTLFKGKAHLSRVDHATETVEIVESIEEQIINDPIDEIDKNGEPVENAFQKFYMGHNAIYIPCQRLAPATEYKYSKMGIIGEPAPALIEYYVYDDGVDITSNVVDNGDGTFNLTAAPVGKVYIDGIARILRFSPHPPSRDTTSVYYWLAEKFGYNIISDDPDKYWGWAVLDNPSYFINKRKTVIEILNVLGEAYTAVTYIENSDLYVFSVYREYSPVFRNYEEFMNYHGNTHHYYCANKDVLDLSFEASPLYTAIKQSATIRRAITDRTGTHIEEERVELVDFTGVPIGTEYRISEEVFDPKFIFGPIAVHNTIFSPQINILLPIRKVIPGYALVIDLPLEFRHYIHSKSSQTDNDDLQIPIRVFTITGVTYNFQDMTMKVRGIWSW